jgi:hypothetical protein
VNETEGKEKKNTGKRLGNKSANEQRASAFS